MRRSARLLAVAAAAAVAAAWGGATGTSSTTAAADCPSPTGTGFYDTTLSPASGPSGSTVTVSGALPAGGQDVTGVLVYWNVDFDHWGSVFSAPLPAVAGSPVTRLGAEDVAQLCTYNVQVTIPSVAPGTYAIEVLYRWAPAYPDGSGWGMASFAPADFQVTSG
jgi:hypothetical protein